MSLVQSNRLVHARDALRLASIIGFYGQRLLTHYKRAPFGVGYEREHIPYRREHPHEQVKRFSNALWYGMFRNTEWRSTLLRGFLSGISQACSMSVSSSAPPRLVLGDHSLNALCLRRGRPQECGPYLRGLEKGFQL